MKCYQCKYIGNVPGSCHHSCQHPENKACLDSPLANIGAIFASVGRVAPMRGNGLKVVTDPHGVQHGWCNYLWNFDPTWIISCDGFQAKVKEELK